MVQSENTKTQVSPTCPNLKHLSVGDLLSRFIARNYLDSQVCHILGVPQHVYCKR